MARREKLYKIAPALAKKGVQIILIQTHEAHSSAWPMGLDSQPEPNKSFSDRVARAQEYISSDSPPFPVYIDGWNDDFEQTFRAWPDKYYALNSDNVVQMKSTYGKEKDALIDVDLIVYLDELITLSDHDEMINQSQSKPDWISYLFIIFRMFFGWIYM